MHHELKKIKDEYIHEIVRYYDEKGIDKDSIMVLDTLIHTAKNLCKLIEICEEEEEGSYSMRGMSYNYNNSYARGRGLNANRDSLGRYSSAGNQSHHDVVNGLYDLMNRTSDEASRRELQDMINRMEAK